MLLFIFRTSPFKLVIEWHILKRITVQVLTYKDGSFLRVHPTPFASGEKTRGIPVGVIPELRKIGNLFAHSGINIKSVGELAETDTNVFFVLESCYLCLWGFHILLPHCYFIHYYRPWLKNSISWFRIMAYRGTISYTVRHMLVGSTFFNASAQFLAIIILKIYWKPRLVK